MDPARFEDWLRAYGSAWERKDTAAFTAIFTADVRYHWTPFGEPKRGRGELADAVGAAVARQREIHFDCEVLAVAAGRGVARWTCGFTRVPGGHAVRLDGILVAEFGADGLCREFREWWHSDEAA